MNHILWIALATVLHGIATITVFLFTFTTCFMNSSAFCNHLNWFISVLFFPASALPGGFDLLTQEGFFSLLGASLIWGIAIYVLIRIFFRVSQEFF